MNNFTIDVLEIGCAADVKRWSSIVDQAVLPDVYYRPEYARACAEAEKSNACALFINASGFRVLLPLLLAEPLDFTHHVPQAWRCAYSPYGYGGILPLDNFSLPQPEQVDALWEALQQWGRQSNVVCLLMRLHPLLGQDKLFEKYNCEDVILRQGNQTIAINLQSWNAAEQRIGSLSAERRRNLLAARNKLGVSWTSGRTESTFQALQTFQVLYDEHMRSLRANEFYFFSEKYYRVLAEGLDTRLGVGLAFQNDQPIAGALFMADARYAHYHLSASNDIGRKHNASTLMINAGAAWAYERGCQMLHLGGGIREGDSLFKFKQTFGGDAFNYSTLMIITNGPAFAAFCETPNAPWPFSAYGKKVGVADAAHS